MLGARVVKKCESETIPLPLDFNKEDFSAVAFDNQDMGDKTSHVSPNEKHHTAIVLYQRKGSEVPSHQKERPTDLGITYSTGRS